jgi:hypothetical protein
MPLPGSEMPVLRTLAVLLCAASLATSAAADSVGEALAVFRDFEARAARFDGSLADLYADDARVTTHRLLPNGSARTLSFRGVEWKGLIRQAMPLARQRGDINSFTQVTARSEADRVVIQAQRTNHLKGYTSPFTLVLRRERPGSSWRIVEERSETRP